MKVALVIDNSGSLNQKDLEIIKPAKIVPISFVVNGEEYYENETMQYIDFYNFLKDKNTNVSTSQPSIELVKNSWKEILNDYDQIVYIILSSGLSEACNVALNASHEEEFAGKVFVVNNQRVAYMNKMAMYQARYLIDHGKTGEEIKEFLEETKNDCGVYIAVDTLKYLKKGGRVTPAAAAIGTLLNIKPILQIHGGKLDAFAKVMSMKFAKSKMIQATIKEVNEKFAEELKEGKVFLGMAHSNPDLLAPELTNFEQEVKSQITNMPLFAYDPLPLFIVCHTGPGALAVGYCVDKLGVVKDMMK